MLQTIEALAGWTPANIDARVIFIKLNIYTRNKQYCNSHTLSTPYETMEPDCWEKLNIRMKFMNSLKDELLKYKRVF